MNKTELSESIENEKQYKINNDRLFERPFDI